MAKRFALGLVLLLAAAVGAADLKLPDQIKGEPGTFIRIPATTNGTLVKWVALDPGLALFPTDLLKDTKTAVVTGPSGSYRVLAYTSDDKGPSDPALCTVVIGTPPGPGPGPGPGPVDDFGKALQTAYGQEADPNKAQQVAYLAAVFAGANTLLGQPDTATAGGLFAKLKGVIHTPGVGIPSGALPKVMKVIGADMNQVLGGVGGAPVPSGNPVDKDKMTAAFSRYAKALGGLK